MDNDSTPPGTKRSNTELYNKLREADKDLVKAIIAPVKDTANEAKGIALSAKKEAGNWKNVKFMAVVSFTIFVAMALTAYFSLKGKVDFNEKSVIGYKADISSVKADMTSVKIDIQEVKTIIGKNQKQEGEKDKKQIEEIKMVIEDALKAQTVTRPRRR